MTSHEFDRAFTDFIHRNLALPKIYTPLKWKQIRLNKNLASTIDINKGIDYIFRDQYGQKKTVQERFRDVTYQQYTDFTIRYRRDNNAHINRRASEFYKIKADYFTYGITNCYKIRYRECTDFVKFAVIDLNNVYDKIKNNQIIIEDNGQMTCKIRDGKLICPVKYNRDGSSTFVPIDIAYLVKLWGNELIISQKGFI